MPSPPTSTKVGRRAAITALLRGGPVPSQETLRDLLARRGIAANQATLSRDLKDLGAVKGPEGYSLPGGALPLRGNGLARALADWLLEAVPVHNQVVLRTPPGGAQPLALALDRARWRHVVGTLAGDDTVLVVTTDRTRAKAIAADLLERRDRS